MLTYLSIRNVAIIDQLNLSFGPGLNILSGETGAGKSIIIDALSLASGGRASLELIRSGEEEALVEAVFDISRLETVRSFLEQAGFDPADELIVKRCLSRTGRNRIFLNGSLATQAQLAELGRLLVTIHGQHESQALLRPEQHLALLDSYAGCDLLRREYAACFARYQELTELLERFEQEQQERVRRRELLVYQRDELLAADLRSGEQEQLEEERRLLAHAERLGMAAGGVFEGLYNSDAALLGELRRMAAVIRDAAQIDPALLESAEQLQGAYLQLEDAALFLGKYVDRIETDPERLRRIEDRLDQLGRLQKKYAPGLEGLLTFLADLEGELALLEEGDCSREERERELAALGEEVRALGQRLSAARREAAGRLEAALAEEVRQLAMPHAVVTVQFEPYDQPRVSGLERVEFLFSPNPGETVRPLARVASGGELSRLMLSFKQILPEGESATLVFDEVDTGVGGAVADMIGRKLSHVAADQQVFCITHLPQVAAWGDRHYKVAKRVHDGRTGTVVTPLERDGVIDEVARMLAGEAVTEAARKHAADLLDRAV